MCCNYLLFAIFPSTLRITWSHGLCLVFLYLHYSLSGAEMSTGSPKNPFFFPVGISETTFPSIPYSQANPCDWVVAKEWGQKLLVHFLTLPLTERHPMVLHALSLPWSASWCRRLSARLWGLGDAGAWVPKWLLGAEASSLLLYNPHWILMWVKDKSYCINPHWGLQIFVMVVGLLWLMNHLLHPQPSA